MEAAIAHLVEALEPALRVAALQLAEQAAAEITAQLSDRSVEVVVSDGDPSLRVTEVADPAGRGPAEELDARITLRLPPSLKQLIEQSAKREGDSVNSWVIDALERRSRRSKSSRNRITEGFDL